MMFLEVQTSFKVAEDAKRISRQIVAERLAACANVVRGNSIYHWKGELEEEGEIFVYFKTDEKHYKTLEARLKELHPYEVPMIVALPVKDGLSDYFTWLTENLSKEQ
jgi:periplasmic divalent cation tolerance protein